MGGLLLYAHLASSPEPRLRSGTALGSSLDYTSSSSGFHRLLKAQRIAEFVPAFPLGLFALYLAPLTGWVPNPMERFNVWSPNVDAATLRRLMANGYSAVPGSLLRQLASAIQPGGLRSSDGRVAYLEGLANVHTPVLAIAGDHDRQCPPAAARVPLDALGSSERRLEVFGTASGHAEHYGHSDLIIGRRAYLEVYPVVAQWLEAQD